MLKDKRITSYVECFLTSNEVCSLYDFIVQPQNTIIDSVKAIRIACEFKCYTHKLSILYRSKLVENKDLLNER